jgi:hypothetical protein
VSLNVLALLKGRERYVFLYEDHQRKDVIQVFGRFASHPDLSFTWYDASVLAQRVRAAEQTQEKRQRFPK